MASTITPSAGSLVTALLAEIERDRERKKSGAPGEEKDGAKQAAPAKDQDNSDDSEDGGREDSPGPPDPRTCTVSGPGFAGGASGAPVNLIITCKDEDGKRCAEGGDDVMVRVVPAGSGAAAGTYIEVTVEDKDNGMYVATYTPPAKGAYSVTVQVNGRDLEGSPFPVFFGPPAEPSAAPPAAGTSTAGAPNAPGGIGAAIAAGTAALSSAGLTGYGNLAGSGLPSLPGSLAVPNALPGGGIDPAAAAAMAASLSSHATLAAANPLLAAFPGFGSLSGLPGLAPVPNLQVDPSARTLLVSNITSQVKPDQLKQLFGLLGGVAHLQMLGADMAMVEMATLQDAQVCVWGGVGGWWYGVGYRYVGVGMAGGLPWGEGVRGWVGVQLIGRQARERDEGFERARPCIRPERKRPPTPPSPEPTPKLFPSLPSPAVATLQPLHPRHLPLHRAGQSALALHGHQLGDKALGVQFIMTAQSEMSNNPLMALKLQQITQMQATMRSGAALAAQVGSMGRWVGWVGAWGGLWSGRKGWLKPGCWVGWGLSFGM